MRNGGGELRRRRAAKNEDGSRQRDRGDGPEDKEEDQERRLIVRGRTKKATSNEDKEQRHRHRGRNKTSTSNEDRERRHRQRTKTVTTNFQLNENEARFIDIDTDTTSLRNSIGILSLTSAIILQRLSLRCTARNFLEIFGWSIFVRFRRFQRFRHLDK